MAILSREILSVGIVILPFIAQGICLTQGMDCRVSEEDSVWQRDPCPTVAELEPT
jgi:hypothetical protein